MRLTRLLMVPAAATAIAIGVFVSAPIAQQQSAGGGAYTQAQADAGRTAYDVNCAGCHGPDLQGGSDAPALTGINFNNAWGSRPVNQLFTHIMQTMPPGSPGSLGEEMTLNVVAYLLQRMGAAPGNQALTRETTRTLGQSVAARGSAPASIAIGAGTGSGQGRGGAAAIRGVTIRGEVKNFVPVTPEMLKNPPAEDWLIFRRNYLGWSYSPLNQITRDNVQDLKLAWVWAMNDTGANQTTPIVHNGVIYLASPSNIVQALDGKTGDLIWETRVGPDQAPGYGGIRSIAIAQDKAMAAVNTRRSTKSVYDEMEKGGAGLRYLNLRGFVTSEGGELLMRDGKVIGAIGMSGGSGAQDGQAARAGVAALGK